MKKILTLLLFAVALASPAYAQSGSTQVVTSCSNTPFWTAGKAGAPLFVDVAGNLCSSATVNVSGLNVTAQPNVTVMNTIANPAIVTCANCATGTSSSNVTVMNTTANPVFVSTPNGFGGGSSGPGPYNVTVTNIADGVDVTLGAKADSAITNSASSGSLVAFVKGLASLLTTTNANLSTLNTSVNSPIPANSYVSISNTPAVTVNSGTVTCTNCTGSAGPFNVTVTNTPAVTNTLATTGGWTPILLTNLLTTANAIKGSAGQLAKLFCYNPNSSVAYIQVYNVAAGSVTVGTTTPLNSYGIPATTSAGFAMSTTGDQYGTAISVAATTGAFNGVRPTTGVDCNASYN